jgi:HSP20 family protein
VLTSRAVRTLSSTENAEWLTQERPSGSFVRQLNLGDGIDADSISASYHNGVLSVVIPVSEKVKPRKVAITAGAPETIAVTPSKPAAVKK